MAEDIAIKVDNVGKTFKLPHEKNNSVKGAVLNFYKRKRTFEKQQVLKDVSFEIKKGEFFGIVGRNGSGKSTLLKILAGIYEPSEGRINVNGKLTPFIELGVGFNPELTGRENVFLNGALLGFSRKEMTALYEEIVEFAELDQFMDQKLKNYSSGMQVRLAFSIAIRAKSEVLLLDEVLAVGDAAFQKKCFDYFVKLKKQKATVVLVTHDMSSVERFCDRVLVIHESESKGVMTSGEAATLYSKMNAPKNLSSLENGHDKANRWGNGKARVTDIHLQSGNNQTKSRSITVNSGDSLTLKLNIESKKQLDLVVGLAFIDQFGVNIAGPNSVDLPLHSNQKVTYHIPSLPFARGEYSVLVSVFDENIIEEFDHYEKAALIHVLSPVEIHGKVDLFGDWSAKND